MYPVLFHIGSFPVRSFGVMILIGFFAGLWLIRRRAAKFGFEPAKMSDVCFYTLIVGILGARVLFLVQERPSWHEVFTIKFEGLTSFGGIIFGAAYIYFWSRSNKANLGRLLDLFAPGFMLAHVFGRIGCFLNGCCFGGTCAATLPWATKFPGEPGLHHPAQIYDSLMNLAGVGLIMLYERKGFRPGQGVAAFLVLHGLTRFIYEFWRAGTDEQVRLGVASSTYWGSLPITQAQGMALGMMLIGAIVWVVARNRGEAPSATRPSVQSAA